MRNHEARRQLIEEMHLRQWPPLSAPAQLLQIIKLVSSEERDVERTLIAETGKDLSSDTAQQKRHLAGLLPNCVPFAWERHTEGSNIVLFGGPQHSQAQIDEASQWLEAMPGRVVRASRIVLVETDDEAQRVLAEVEMETNEIVAGKLASGVSFWSDFRLHRDDYGDVVIAANGADPLTLSRTVQQLQEFGNYRNLALLALPAVRGQWSELDVLEDRLGAFAADVNKVEMRDDDLLERVSDLSLDLANHVHAIGYRLNATKAYAQLVSERIEDLAAAPLKGFHSLEEFSRRRFMPAVRTCAAHRERLDELRSRAGDLTSLLRARINTRIENQNGRLLKSMEQRATTQLRLQQLVEGLSIFALAYYGVGLLGYVLGALEEIWPIPSREMIEGIAVPVVMLVIWLAMRQLKRRIFLSSEGRT